MPDLNDLNDMAHLVAGCAFVEITDPNNRARIVELCLMDKQAEQTAEVARWLEQIDISMTTLGEWFERSDHYRKF